MRQTLSKQFHVGATGSVLLVAISLIGAGCAQKNAPDASIGQLRPVTNGTSLTIPALWAASQSDGSLVGGVEPAEVQVLENGDGKFTVDLSTIESRGAGPQWKAATAQAAAVGTLMSGVDPANVDLGFTITGSIDGPSAGGLLTAGVLANIQRDALLPGVTMTGTISPDGSIGVVGYVPTKLAAAASAGYTTAIVPAGLGNVENADGSQVSLVEYGKSVGIEVKEVRTVAEAYLALTGKPYAQFPAKPIVASPSSSTAIISTTKNMVDQLTAAYASAPQGTDPATLKLVQSAIPTMNAAIAAQKWDQAYGVGAFAYLRLARASGAAQVSERLAAVGQAQTELEIRKAITSSLLQATKARDAALTSARPTVEQLLSLPGAVGWSTYAIACYQGLLLELAKSNDAAALTKAGRILGEERAGVEVMMPDALKVLNAMPSITPAPASKMKNFLAGYARLLNNAGSANLNYITALAGKPLLPDGTIGDDGLIGASQALQLAANKEKPPVTLDAALLQTANALTYYAVSSGIVSGHQVYGLESGGNDLKQSASPQALDAAIASGSATVESYSQKLRAMKLTVGYPLWSTRWGTAAAAEYRKTNLAAEASWIGLNEIWYDAVSMFMMNAFSQSK